MARIARVVVPGAWHHVTQRGNHQQMVFLNDADREFYLGLLERYTARYAVRISGYCLMGNHVHIVAVPADEKGLAKALGLTHNDYARWWNLQRLDTGHVWQNRIYSCPLDERHAWEALRYIELNPVRAGLVRHAEDWRWSSAQVHLHGSDTSGLVDLSEWAARWTPASWREALHLGLEDAVLVARIRESTRTGRPAVAADFLHDLERQTGRHLQLQKRGPKRRQLDDPNQLQLGVS